MEYVEKRKLSEILVLYSLEPDLKDIYVEGITDKLCYSSVIECLGLSIIEIDSIDFSELYETSPYLKRNNRRKIIELSNQLSSSFGYSLINVSCIVDADFDFFAKDVVWNCYLKYTDYTSLEMYFFNENTLNELSSKILHDFPIPSRIVLQELSNVLVNLFFIRLSLINCLCVDEFSEVKITDIKNSISFNKKSGAINFEPENHIQKILNSNRLMHRRDEIIECYKTLKSNPLEDNRYQIRGHDFIYLLFLLIDKIKNNIKLSEAALERILPLCVCKETLKRERLILELNKKYSA